MCTEERGRLFFSLLHHLADPGCQPAGLAECSFQVPDRWEYVRLHLPIESGCAASNPVTIPEDIHAPAQTRQALLRAVRLGQEALGDRQERFVVRPNLGCRRRHLLKSDTIILDLIWESAHAANLAPPGRVSRLGQRSYALAESPLGRGAGPSPIIRG